MAKVKLSSTEPEIGAGSYAGKRSAYLRGFIGEIIQLPRVPIQHIVDNSATPALTSPTFPAALQAAASHWGTIIHGETP